MEYDQSITDENPLLIIERASRALRSERQELIDECEAFSQFRDLMSSLDTTPVSTESSTALTYSVHSNLDRLQEAYIETVMSVPHFEEAYDESYQESLARELNPELAAAVMTADQLSPQLQELLGNCVDQAITGRTSLIEIFEAELSTLTTMRDRLDEIMEDLESILDQPLEQAEFHVLASSRDRLSSLESCCERYLEERQADLHQQHQVSILDIDNPAHVLYQPCETTHPVLSTIAMVCIRIEDGYRTIDQRLAALERP